MNDLAFNFFLFLIGLPGIALGVSAIREIHRGEAQSLSRMSTRIFHRRTEPFDFWVTVATGLAWGVLGGFLWYLMLGSMIGVF